MNEISEEEWNKLEKVKDYEVLEIDEKWWNGLELERLERLKEKKLRIWESKKRRDEIWREKFECRVLEILKKKYERESKLWFRRIVRERRKLFVGYKKVKLVSRDNYYWRIEIIGIRSNGEKVVILSRNSGLVDLDEYRRKFNL